MNGSEWSDEELAVVRELYPATKTSAIAARLGRSVSSIYRVAAKMGLAKTPEYLASPDACRLRREASPRSIASRFRPGSIPFNKGLKRPGWSAGRMSETQFKKGSRSGRAKELWQPIGATRLTKEGYLQQKVSDTGNTVVDYVEVHRLLWEKSFGPIPAGHVVIFKDNDRTNISIENLQLLTRVELMRRNSVHRWGKEVFEVIQLRGALNRKLRRFSEKQDIGSAQPSV